MNTLPAWERAIESSFSLMDDGEEWKLKEHLEATKNLYNKWREIFDLTLAYTEIMTDEPGQDPVLNDEQWSQKLIYENLVVVAPKIISACGCDLYILQMENAAFIRFNCMKMMEQVRFASMMGHAGEEYTASLNSEMNEFKDLFKEWVGTFRRDDIEDDWGVF